MTTHEKRAKELQKLLLARQDEKAYRDQIMETCRAARDVAAKALKDAEYAFNIAVLHYECAREQEDEIIAALQNEVGR